LKEEFQDFECALSGEHIYDIMKNTHNDVMVFPLAIVRPEHSVESPSMIVVVDVPVGQYSFDSFQQAMQFSISSDKSVHGGFIESKKNVNLDGPFENSDTAELIGFFKGPDGKKMNACLPLYLNEDHWRRVEYQLEPYLGYFFCLDPMGFKEEQYLAVFTVLGSMILMKSNNKFNSEYADWLVDDFTKLCSKILPKFLHHMEKGRFASGKFLKDPLELFLESPFGRTKDLFSNLITLVGWTCASDYLNKREKSTFKSERFIYAFVEETWRRSFGYYYKSLGPQIVMDKLEELMYGKFEQELKNNDEK